MDQSDLNTTGHKTGPRLSYCLQNATMIFSNISSITLQKWSGVVGSMWRKLLQRQGAYQPTLEIAYTKPSKIHTDLKKIDRALQMHAMGNFLQTSHALELRFRESREELDKKLLLLEAISRLSQSLSQDYNLGWTQAQKMNYLATAYCSYYSNEHVYLPPTCHGNQCLGTKINHNNVTFWLKSFVFTVNSSVLM